MSYWDSKQQRWYASKADADAERITGFSPKQSAFLDLLLRKMGEDTARMVYEAINEALGDGDADSKARHNASVHERNRITAHVLRPTATGLKDSGVNALLDATAASKGIPPDLAKNIKKRKGEFQ